MAGLLVLPCTCFGHESDKGIPDFGRNQNCRSLLFPRTKTAVVFLNNVPHSKPAAQPIYSLQVQFESVVVVVDAIMVSQEEFMRSKVQGQNLRQLMATRRLKKSHQVPVRVGTLVGKKTPVCHVGT